jgi:aminopeptidase N
MKPLFALFLLFMSSAVFAQMPLIEPGVSQELARWRAARYSDVRYKLNLTLEKMSPVLKGTMEVRVNVGTRTPSSATGTRTPSSATPAIAGELPPIILDWRKIRGHEEKSTVTNLSINGNSAVVSPPQAAVADGGVRGPKSVRVPYESEHLVFRDGVVAGENVIKLDFTSPILPSGSAITRYVDKEDGSEYIYSLFVPSDASTAFPVFDQPDLKARFTLSIKYPEDWKTVSNTQPSYELLFSQGGQETKFYETRPISTYVFAFAVGDFDVQKGCISDAEWLKKNGVDRCVRDSASYPDARDWTNIYVRKSQAAKFKPHAVEVFRLNREAVKYFEQYFDYKFPFPKYDLVLIPEFPFGGMEHAGATFLREASVIFPQEPTKNDHISRATLIFHEAAHQWFGDTVTMRWFDDLWLKEGFATFTAYKAMEKIMPEMNAWKVFYERIKQGAYQTDSTRGTTAIYQPIANLSAAKSAYGNIVYNKAPAFLRQAEFYLGEDKFQTAVRAFLKKYEFGNAGWGDLVQEFENVRPPGAAKAIVGDRTDDMASWAKQWVTVPGVPIIRTAMLRGGNACYDYGLVQTTVSGEQGYWREKFLPLIRFADGKEVTGERFLLLEKGSGAGVCDAIRNPDPVFFMPNYRDYGYGIFLLDEKSREYVLKNIRREKDPFLRAMMWGSLWDSVREGELDPRVFVELVVKVLGSSRAITTPSAQSGGHPSLDKEGSQEDESTVAALLGRVGTALNYYMSVPPAVAGGALSAGDKTPPATDETTDLRARVEDLLIERMRSAPTLGQRITYYRALLNIAASEKARGVLKTMLATGGNLSGSEGAPERPGALKGTLPTGRVTAPAASEKDPGSIPLKTKDRFDIVTRLLILGDPEAPRLLADLEKTETSDDAKRYAYAARAGIGTAENKAKYWNDFVSNKEISESWIEAAFGPWNSIRHSEITLPYLERALRELPNHKRSRKIFFVNGWLGAFIGGQRSAEALAIVNKFLADNPALDNDLRLKILENVDLIERAVNIRRKFPQV